MSAITDNDLQELKDLINKRFDRLGEDITELKVEIGKNQQNLAGLDKRLSNIEFTNRGIFISLSTGFVLAALGAFTKFLFFNPNL